MALRAMPRATRHPPGRRQRGRAGVAGPHRRRRPDRHRPHPPGLPVLEGTAERAPEGVPKGAYILVDESGDGLDLVLIGTGSEVQLCVAAAEAARRRRARPCGSCRCRRGSCSQISPTRTRRRCCRPACPRWRWRPACSLGWERYADDVDRHRPLRRVGAGRRGPGASSGITRRQRRRPGPRPAGTRASGGRDR